MIGVRSQESGVGSWGSGVRSQESGVRSQESGTGSRGSEVRSQEKEKIGAQKSLGVLCGEKGYGISSCRGGHPWSCSGRVFSRRHERRGGTARRRRMGQEPS